MTWDPDIRLATLSFVSDTDATGSDASRLTGALSTWIGSEALPFALLGDGRGLRSVDAEYRRKWSDFLRRHRDVCFVALFHMGPIVRIAAEMFRIGSGLRVKAFAHETDARAWLREMGIRA